MNRVVVVSFRTSDAGSWANVTTANTLFEAVREAWHFFHTDFWRGPKPTLETIFEVSLVGDERRWRVMGRKALH